MHSRGTGSTPAVSVLVPVLDHDDLAGLWRRVGELDVALRETVASHEIVVVLDGVASDEHVLPLPPGVRLRRRARRGGRGVVLREGIALSRGVVLLVVEGTAGLSVARLRSFLAAIKGGADLVTGIDVASGAGVAGRAVAHGRAWLRGRYGLSGGCRAFRRHARDAALAGGVTKTRTAKRIVTVAV